jgi:hypothetical protein
MSDDRVVNNKLFLELYSRYVISKSERVACLEFDRLVTREKTVRMDMNHVLDLCIDINRIIGSSASETVRLQRWSLNIS